MTFELSCKRVNMLPVIETPFAILTNLSNAITYIIERFSKLLTSFESPRIPEFIEQSQNVQKQMIDSLFFTHNIDYFSRLYLRTTLGLSPSFKEDHEAIMSLQGSISDITREKINVVEIVRNMRDNE